MVEPMRWLTLLLLCAACAPPTPEAASDALVLQALDALASRDPDAARARLDAALRLDRANARAGALRDLVALHEGLTLELHDVRDLGRPVTELRCDLRIEVAGDGAAGSFSVEEERDAWPIAADELVELVESTLGEDEVGSVERSRGILIVRTTPRQHAALAALLAELRRRKLGETALDRCVSFELRSAGGCDPRWLDALRTTLAERKVTLNFPDSPLAEVASFIADVTGQAVVVAPAVNAESTVSLRLRDVSLLHALALIAAQTGTVVRVHGGALSFEPAR